MTFHLKDLRLVAVGGVTGVAAEAGAVARTDEHTLLTTVTDSVSGESFVRVADTQTPQHVFTTDTAVEGARLESVFRHWAILLRQRLDQVHELPPFASGAP